MFLTVCVFLTLTDVHRCFSGKTEKSIYGLIESRLLQYTSCEAVTKVLIVCKCPRPLSSSLRDNEILLQSSTNVRQMFDLRNVKYLMLAVMLHGKHLSFTAETPDAHRD